MISYKIKILGRKLAEFLLHPTNLRGNDLAINSVVEMRYLLEHHSVSGGSKIGSQIGKLMKQKAQNQLCWLITKQTKPRSVASAAPHPIRGVKRRNFR